MQLNTTGCSAQLVVNYDVYSYKNKDNVDATTEVTVREGGCSFQCRIAHLIPLLDCILPADPLLDMDRVSKLGP